MRKLYKDTVIQSRLYEACEQINHDYLYKDFVLLGVLSGGYMLTTDLSRLINNKEHEINFCTVKSYVDRFKGINSPINLIGKDFEDKDILICDDINDSGETILRLKTLLTEVGAKSVKSIVCIDRVLDTEKESSDYSLFKHYGSEWFIGYGMDYNGKYRGLKDICVI